MNPQTSKKKRRGREKKPVNVKRPALGHSLIKSSYKDSQEAFFSLAETTDKQKYLSQQAYSVLSCAFVMEAISCHTKVVRHCFKILQSPTPVQVENFVKIALELIAKHPEILFYYLITYPDSVRHLVSHITNTSILKLLLSLWNCTPHTTVQLNALDQIGKEILAQLLNSEYSLVSEHFSHMLVFLEVLIRRLHAVKMQTAQGTMRKCRWNPIRFGVNKDQLRNIKVDTEQSLQVLEDSPHNNSPKTEHKTTPRPKKVDDLLSALPSRKASAPGLETEEKDGNDFLLFLNDKENAELLVRKSLNALHSQTRIKTVQLLSTLVRHTQKRVSTEDIPEFIKQIVKHSSDYLRALEAIPTETVGFYRLAIVQLFRWLFTLRNTEFILDLVSQPVTQLIIDYLFQYPTHVFLLNEIEGLISSLCRNPANISERILDDSFFDRVEKLRVSQTETMTFPCVGNICATIIQNSNRLTPREWRSFKKHWKKRGEHRPAHSHLTRTKQLDDHWDDFHFLYSAF